MSSHRSLKGWQKLQLVSPTTARLLPKWKKLRKFEFPSWQILKKMSLSWHWMKIQESPRNKIEWILTTRQSWLDDHRSGTWKEHEMPFRNLWIKHHISWIFMELHAFEVLPGNPKPCAPKTTATSQVLREHDFHDPVGSSIPCFVTVPNVFQWWRLGFQELLSG